jgi:replicative DNA helicase
VAELSDKGTEAALLAACVFRPETYHTAANHCTAEDFNDMVASSIFRAVGDLHANGIHPDPVTITDAATAMMAMSPLFHDPEDLIAERIDSLKAVRFSPENIERYARKIRRLSGLRNIEITLQGTLSEVTSDGKPEELASRAMETLLKVANPVEGRNLFHYSELRQRYIDSLTTEMEYLQEHGELPGIRFDFAPVDDYTHGLRPEDLVILAGDPGSGKTSVSMALLRRRGIKAMLQREQGQDVGGSLFVSLEMGEDATAMRWSQMIASMTSRELRGGMTQSRIDNLNQRWEHEDDIPLWTLFAAGMKADQLKARIAFMVKKHNIDLVVLDHFRRIRMDGRLHDNALDEARIQYLKSEICKGLGVSVIVIAHTNKSSAAREDKKPRMSDLSGSQMVAAEADYIVFVYRPYEHLTDADKNDSACPWEPTDAYLVWRKNRNDRSGDARFIFDGATMLIEDPATRGRPVGSVSPPPLVSSYGEVEESGELF